MRAIREIYGMGNTIRSRFVCIGAFTLLAAVAACGELTGPESPSTPTNVVATLASPTSVVVTWTPSPLSDGVISYSIYRNGNKVGESTTTSYTDTGLSPQTTYVYSVAANCLSGVVSDRSVETAASTATTIDVTPPRVISHTPAPGQTGVSLVATATATFSEPMDPNSINTSTFTLRVTGGAAIAGTVTYNAATRTAEFDPTGSLPNPVNITATITTGAKDLAGNALAAAFTWSFTTRDESPPSVIATSPANGATVVSANPNITVTFSEPMDAVTINSTNITLRVTSSGAPVEGTVTYNPATRVATFTPNAALGQGSFTVTVSGVRDAAGNVLPSPFQFSFTVDTIPPTVTNFSPASNATGVAVNSTVQITFSEAMNAATIIPANVFVRNTATDAVVPAGVSYNAGTFVATITPALSNATNYTIVVTTGVTDAAGNAMATQRISAFTTVALADVTPPTVVSSTPGAGATGVPMSLDSVTVSFSEPMDASTITTATIRLTAPGSSTNICTSVVYVSDNLRAVCRFTPPLLSLTTYTITVTTGVEDAAGNPIASSSTRTFTFTTVQDVIAPTVTGRTPVAATGVPVTTTVTFTFSENMDPATINSPATSVQLRVTGGAPIVGNVSYNPSTRVATFTPSLPLSFNTDYTATVTTGAKDLAGNPLALQSSFTFRTVAAP